MSTPGSLESLTRAVEAMHNCKAQHASAGLVHEMMDGKTVWKGNVEIFTLSGHPKADKAFAWAYRDENGEVEYLAVLSVPPINSPREAVQAAIASGAQK
ncbi:MAG: hypothetical protein K1X78_21125 [Verrucomicrobiaceae bacterium]|nr:hypothetical protein [Verrucomicrobiaceae bacterium]